MKPETKNCQNCKNDFTIEPDDFSFYEKIKVPPPTFCPECRMIRRFNWRNEGFLFRRKEGYSGKEIFSGFSPEASVTTYENSFWFGTDWDPLATGRNYDFSKPFFEQFRELFATAPIMARSVLNMINSDYCNEASECKNSYLCFNTDYVENSAYCRKVVNIKDSFDVYECQEDELCYENVFVDKSYAVFFSFDCDSCVDVWFSRSLRGCTNCFGCVNLANKSYYFFNQSCSKEEYIKKVGQYKLSSFKEMSSLLLEIRKFWNKLPVRYNHSLRTLNSTGERIYDVKNVKDSYSVKKSQNLRFCQDIPYQANDCYDYSIWGAGAENIYETLTCGIGVYNLKFCFNTWEEARDLEYCGYCPGAKNCFGCVGLSKKEYCILNKQYNKEEYFILIEKIKRHMIEMPYIDSVGRSYGYGEFFPFELSPVAYNESLANEFFPLMEERAREQGLIWREMKMREYKATLQSETLHDNINDINESILNEVIECADCNRPFRIISSELKFYKRFSIPIPRFCHECRFKKRFKLVNPPKLWRRKCMKQGCTNEFETSYAPDRPEIVYCEKCYQHEVY